MGTPGTHHLRSQPATHALSHPRRTAWIIGLLFVMVLFAPAPGATGQPTVHELHGAGLGAAMMAPSSLVLADSRSSSDHADVLLVVSLVGLLTLAVVALRGWPRARHWALVRTTPVVRTPALRRGPPATA